MDLAPYLGNPTGALASTSLDLYSAANNPYGNLYNNGLNFQYSAYATSPFAGYWPSGWAGYFTSSVPTGKVVTGNVVGNTGGPGNMVQIVVSWTGTAGNNANAGISIYNLITNPFTVATNVECWERIAVNANSPFTQINLRIAANGGNANIADGNSFYGVSIPGNENPQYTPGPTTAWSGIIHAPPTTIPVGQTITIYHDFNWNDSAGTFTGTLNISQETCRQVPANDNL